MGLVSSSWPFYFFHMYGWTVEELTSECTGFPAIVTRFHLLTRPLPDMYQSIYIWPISEYRKVLKWVIHVSQLQDPPFVN